MADRIEKPSDLYLVAFDLWLPTHAGERVVKTMIKRSTRSAERQVRRIPEWPYAAHLLGLWHTPTSWSGIEADELTRQVEAMKHGRTESIPEPDDPGPGDDDAW